jgi:hypothetical protein
VTANRARTGLVLLAAALTVWLGVRAAAAFDVDRHRTEADALLRAPDLRAFDLPAFPAGKAAGISGRFQHRPDGWLSVVTLRGLPPVAGDDRYLVFMRNWGGWALAGAVRPDARGEAEVRYAAEPRARTIYEVIVTRGVDDAANIPHGVPLLRWYDRARAPRRAGPFDFDNPLS